MSLFLALLGNPFVIKLALSFLEAWATSKQSSEEQRKKFIELAQVLRDLGAKSARSRYESEDRQNAELDALWKEEDRLANEAKKSGGQP